MGTELKLKSSKSKQYEVTRLCIHDKPLAEICDICSDNQKSLDRIASVKLENKEDPKKTKEKELVNKSKESKVIPILNENDRDASLNLEDKKNKKAKKAERQKIVNKDIEVPVQP